VTLKDEERTSIRETVLNGKNVPRVDRVDFSLTVGTAVPSRVRVVEVPDTLIRIHPEWRDHSYFVVSDEIVIVDRGHKVVATVPIGSSGSHANAGGTINLSQGQIRELQIVLREKGFDIGQPDGVMGSRTKEALISFQRQQGFRATGQVDVETVTALGIKGEFDPRGSSQPNTAGQGDRPDNSGRNNSSGGSVRDGDDNRASENQDRNRPADTGAGRENRNSRNNDSQNRPATTGQGQAGESGRDSRRDNSPADGNRNNNNRERDNRNDSSRSDPGERRSR